MAGLLELTVAQVHDTASFYTMFRLQPEGKTLIEVCTTLSCALGGADGLLDRTCKKLGIEPHGTTKDGKFTVKPVECLAACGGAPAVQVERGVARAGDRRGHRQGAGGARSVYRKFDWPKSPDDQLFLFKNVWKKDSRSIETYKAAGGYANLKKYLSMKPEEIIETVKKSNLRGRGGAGFPTGMKWGFLPKDNPKPRYLCVNADESEPGHLQGPGHHRERSPPAHRVHRRLHLRDRLEGRLHLHPRRVPRGVPRPSRAPSTRPTPPATWARTSWAPASTSTSTCTRGAGSYECGEETALIESLEGKRGQPRLKPPFPAAVGVFGCPTIVNNVETLACVPLILEKGAEWFASMGTEKNGGPKLYSISGDVKRPGSYEIPMGKVTLRQLIDDYAGGPRDGRKIKAVVPGGSSTPVLTADELDVAMDFDSLAKAGSHARLRGHHRHGRHRAAWCGWRGT